MIDAAAIGLTWWLRPTSMWFKPELAIAGGGVLGFVVVAFVIGRKMGARREAGQTLMLYGLLWLIVYDATFAAVYVDWAAGLALLVLLPVAWSAVQVMRWWSKLVAVSHRPAFKRAGT